MRLRRIRGLMAAAAFGLAAAATYATPPTDPPANTLFVAAELPTPALPEGWFVETKNFGWGPTGLYVRVFTKGNCRDEEREVCYPAPGGGTHCRIIVEEVCDEGITRFPFGPEVVIVDETWVYLTRDDAAPIVFAKAFKTWPYRNIVAFRGAKLRFTIQDPDGAPDTVGVELDLDKLGQSKQQAFFMELFPTTLD